LALDPTRRIFRHSNQLRSEGYRVARRYVNILWVPEGSDDVRQFRITMWPLYAFAGIAALAVILLFGSGAAYIGVARTQGVNRVLQAENEALRSELVTLGAETDHLDRSVKANIHLANETRLLAGLTPYGEEIALQGVGGSPAAGFSSARPGLTPSVGRTVGLYHERLEQLSRQLTFQEESFREVKEIIAASQSRLDRIPTINPISGPCFFSSGFGARRDPFTGRPSLHTGVDLRAPEGSPFRATADGRVRSVGYNGDFGQTIEIDHGQGYVSVYAHADRTFVRCGQSVRRGDKIGEVGHSGRTTGNHLHYEVHQDGRAVNPRQFILQGDHFLD
jgi:murein DD-endopeptidase MepM/ murein hydrolase activator NlpD